MLEKIPVAKGTPVTMATFLVVLGAYVLFILLLHQNGSVKPEKEKFQPKGVSSLHGYPYLGRNHILSTFHQKKVLMISPPY